MDLITDLMVQMDVDPKDITFCDEEGNFGITNDVLDWAFMRYNLDRYSEFGCTMAYNATMLELYRVFYKPKTSHFGLDIQSCIIQALFHAKIKAKITNPHRMWTYCIEWSGQYYDVIDRNPISSDIVLGKVFGEHLKQIFNNDDSEESI